MKAKMPTFVILVIETYLVSWALYFGAALAYSIGVRPLVYGGFLELLTGLLAVGLINRFRPDFPWPAVLIGVTVGRVLRGITEVSAVHNSGNLSLRGAMTLVAVRVLLVVIGATGAIWYRRWRVHRVPVHPTQEQSGEKR